MATAQNPRPDENGSSSLMHFEVTLPADSPTDGESLFSDHGRGIYLINKLMDEVKYERNGSEIHMRKF